MIREGAPYTLLKQGVVAPPAVGAEEQISLKSAVRRPSSKAAVPDVTIIRSANLDEAILGVP